MNSCCWDCNVFGLSPKVTEGNYVRNLCGVVSVLRLKARPWPAAAHRHRGQALPPSTGEAGDSRETVITFAGARSVSGETDGTIARRIHRFSALFWCAKASWFHASALRLQHWCPRFHIMAGRAVSSRKSSPCSAWCGCKREKVRPAHENWPKNAVLWRAGRVFSRKCRKQSHVGRVFSRV